MPRHSPRGFLVAKTKVKAQPVNEDTDEELEEQQEDCRITRESNHVYFHAEVTRDTIFDLVKLIRKAEEDCLILGIRHGIREVPVYLHISSFGGDVFAAFTAIDAIQACRVPVYTIIEGATASAGTLISVVGKRRFITPKSYMLIHQLSSGFWGKMAEIEDEFHNLQELMTQIRNTYKEHARVPKKELNEILKHDLWWDATKSLAYGLVDEIWTGSLPA
jgi:ATP-dependent protease ClpP protease subunit